MRIRNSRNPFFLATAPEPAPRSGHFHSRISSKIDDRFLVEETNRRIEWSSLPLRKPPSPVEEELQGEVEESTPKEMRSLKGVGEEKDLKQCMRINSNPALKDQSEGKDYKQKGSAMDANSQGYWNDGNRARKVVLALPAPNSDIGKKFSFTKMARKAGGAKIQVNDKMVESKGKDSLIKVEVKMGNLTDVFRKEVATEEVGNKKFDLNKVDLNAKVIMIEEETETREVIMQKLEVISDGLNEIDSFQRTLSTNFITDCDSYVSSWMVHNQQGCGKKEVGSRIRRGRKRRGSNQPDSSSSLLQHRDLEHQRGWSERLQGYHVFNWWEGEHIPKRGRPKKIATQSRIQNIMNVEKPRRKRGRPKRVLDIDLNQPRVSESM